VVLATSLFGKIASGIDVHGPEARKEGGRGIKAAFDLVFF
jgi:hypothetical protein